MTRPGKPGGEGSGEPGKKYSARDIARIFGDVLPEQTSDERPDDPSASGAGSSARTGADSGSDVRDERWYRENRPPHHGG